jgi:hypothetical protein
LIGLYTTQGRLIWTLPDGTTADQVAFDVDVVGR